jgi:hypothetical protein
MGRSELPLLEERFTAAASKFRLNPSQYEELLDSYLRMVDCRLTHEQILPRHSGGRETDAFRDDRARNPSR